MAINAANTTETAARPEPIEVDINMAGLAEGVDQEIDTKEDWQARACPPPKGKYTLKLTLENSTFEQGQKRGYSASDPNGKYYTTQVICKIQDPTGKWQDSVIFYKVSTGVPKGKKMSTMAGLMVMCGVKMPVKINDLKLAKSFYQIIAKNQPVIVGECDWSTWDKEAGKGEYGAALLVGMDNFPKKADGTHHHIVKNKAGVEFPAKLKLVRWVGKPGQAQPASDVQTVVPGQKAKPTPAAKAQVQETFAKVEEEVPTVESNAGGMVFDDEGEIVIE